MEGRFGTVHPIIKADFFQFFNLNSVPAEFKFTLFPRIEDFRVRGRHVPTVACHDHELVRDAGGRNQTVQRRQETPLLRSISSETSRKGEVAKKSVSLVLTSSRFKSSARSSKSCCVTDFRPVFRFKIPRKDRMRSGSPVPFVALTRIFHKSFVKYPPRGRNRSENRGFSRLAPPQGQPRKLSGLALGKTRPCFLPLPRGKKTRRIFHKSELVKYAG